MLDTALALPVALAAGILPALLWLWFWVREDRRCPEPKGLIALAFLAGMIAVPLVIPLQKAAGAVFTGTALVIAWAAIEELLKVGAAYITVLKNKAMDEPVDALLYLITVALGFAALENALFLLSPITNGFVAESVLTGNFRFIGATLLHTLASATVGVALALTFYKPETVKRLALYGGIILAAALHSLFNFSILKSDGDALLTIFMFVWIGIIIVILLFERIKGINNPRSLVIER